MEYYKKAEDYQKRALEMSPNHRASRTYLVAVYMESGQEPLAREIFAQSPDMLRLIDIGKRRVQAPYRDRVVIDDVPAPLRIRDLYIGALSRAGSSGRTQ
jgi:hypothetical protein